MNAQLNFQPADDAPPPRLAMAPLVDIVLLLICFYLLVMNSMQSRSDVNLTLPTMQHEHTSDVYPTELIINIDPAGQIVINGVTTTRQHIAELLTAQQKETGELHVTIRADAEQRFELLNEVMDACRQVGVKIVTLRTLTEGDAR